MHDNLIKGWALWGDYLDNIFVKERWLSWIRDPPLSDQAEYYFVLWKKTNIFSHDNGSVRKRETNIFDQTNQFI
jgi:hypothetical protein